MEVNLVTAVTSSLNAAEMSQFRCSVMMYRDIKTTKVMTTTYALMLSQDSEHAFVVRADRGGVPLVEILARSSAAYSHL